MEANTLVAISLFLLVLIVTIAYAAWRVQRRIAERADAERRMGAALEELHRLTAELRARQAARPSGPTGSAPGAEGGR